MNAIATLTHASSRQLLLGVILLGIVGLQVELALLRHADSFQQWIPHIALMIGLLSTLTIYIRPGPATLRAFQVIMLIFLVVGALGVYLHFIGNVEFARERNPSLGGAALVWKALRGATPALAPGALARLGLLGLLYSYRHPALSAGSIQNSQNVD
jgi:hypothetical protein